MHGLLIEAVRVTDPANLPLLVNWILVGLIGVTVTKPVAGVTDQVTELPEISALLSEYISDVHIFPAPPIM